MKLDVSLDSSSDPIFVFRGGGRLWLYDAMPMVEIDRNRVTLLWISHDQRCRWKGPHPSKQTGVTVLMGGKLFRSRNFQVSWHREPVDLEFTSFNGLPPMFSWPRWTVRLTDDPPGRRRTRSS